MELTPSEVEAAEKKRKAKAKAAERAKQVLKVREMKTMLLL